MNPTNKLKVGQEGPGEVKVPVGSYQPDVHLAHQLTYGGGPPWRGAYSRMPGLVLPRTGVPSALGSDVNVPVNVRTSHPSWCLSTRSGYESSDLLVCTGPFLNLQRKQAYRVSLKS